MWRILFERLKILGGGNRKEMNVWLKLEFYCSIVSGIVLKVKINQGNFLHKGIFGSHEVKIAVCDGHLANPAILVLQ